MKSHSTPYLRLKIEFHELKHQVSTTGNLTLSNLHKDWQGNQPVRKIAFWSNLSLRRSYNLLTEVSNQQLSISQ